MYRDKIIKISRSKNIEESVEVAILKLDTIFHYKGVFCMVNYKDADENLDSVVALGLHDGIGRDCYKIVSLHKDNIVWGVQNFLPDISNLVHDEKYIYHNTEEEGWYIVYGIQRGEERWTRIIERVGELYKGWTKFINLADYTEWVYDPDDKKVRLLYDFYNKKEIEDLIEKVRREVRYVDFDTLTPSQIEMLRGPAGSVDNFVVLTEDEYRKLAYKDPNKFYFTYDEEGRLFVHVDDNTILVIESNAVVYEQDSSTVLEINYPGHTRYNSSGNERVLWLSNNEIVDENIVVFSRDSGEFTEDFYLTLSANSGEIRYNYYEGVTLPRGIDVSLLDNNGNTRGDDSGDVAVAEENKDDKSIIYTKPILIDRSCLITAFTRVYITTDGEEQYVDSEKVTRIYKKTSEGDRIVVDEDTNTIEDTSGVNTVDENNNWNITTPGTVSDNILTL